MVINIFCDDPASGKFRIQLYANRKKLFSDPEDAEELENLRKIVCARIEPWAGSCAAESFDR